MEYQWIDPILLVELRGQLVYATSKDLRRPQSGGRGLHLGLLSSECLAQVSRREQIVHEGQCLTTRPGCVYRMPPPALDASPRKLALDPQLCAGLNG